MTIAAAISLRLRLTDTGSPDVGQAAQEVSELWESEFENGTGAGQADRWYSDTGTVNASSAVDLDLAGTLANIFGTVQSFARIKALAVKASATNTNTVILGDDAGSPWTALFGADGTLTLRPGQWVATAVSETDATGLAVVATTGDLLQVANGGAGTSVAYTILALGCSA